MAALIVDVVLSPYPGRQHIDWYLDHIEQARHFPILTASRHGVSSSPSARASDIPAAAWDLAQRAAQQLATDPHTDLDDFVRRYHQAAARAATAKAHATTSR
jgi:hypothetical protein